MILTKSYLYTPKSGGIIPFFKKMFCVCYNFWIGFVSSFAPETSELAYMSARVNCPDKNRDACKLGLGNSLTKHSNSITQNQPP